MLNKSTDSLGSIRIWDPLIRIFHWVLVISFLIAYLSEDDFIIIHSYAGYVILLLLLIRIIWGLIGTQYARFSNFIYSPKTIIHFLQHTLQFKAKRYLGHNPAGGVMVILLLLSLLLCSMSGLLVYAIEDNAGPLAHWISFKSFYWGEIVEEAHEFFANFTLFLVFIHIAGVIIESLIHKENLIKAMITGNKYK